MRMYSPNGFRFTALALIVAGGLAVSSVASAQTSPPPPQEPPPAYNQPPPGYQQQPPPGYEQQPPAQQPPPAYNQPPPGYQQPPAAYAPPPGYGAPPPPPQNLHDGFYLRLHLGGGYGHIGASIGGVDQAFVGSGGSFGVAIGGAVAPNFIIFGNLFGIVLSDPDVEVNGTHYGSVSGTTTVAGIGPGIAYYIDPYNIYISGTIGAMSFQGSDSNGNSQIESKTGYGFQGMVGKEWWVTQDWGIGLAGEFIATGGMADKVDSSIKWGSTSFALVFSATYN